MNEIKEYITIKREDYDFLQCRIHTLENNSDIEKFAEMLKDNEGVAFVVRDMQPYKMVGFITSKELETKLNKLIDLNNKYYKLPKFVRNFLKKYIK